MKCPECSADTRLCQCATAEREQRAISAPVAVLELPVSHFGHLGLRAFRDHYEYRYTVTGRGQFPEDMLRYDDARIVATRISPHNARWTECDIRAPRCTPARWRSFGWTVHDPVREVRYRSGIDPKGQP